MDHHFVPRFYLDAFCDLATPEGQEPWVWVADLQERTVRRRAPQNVARRPDYYAFRDREGGPSQEVERLLGQIESAAAPVVARLLRGELELGGQQRADLAFFVAVLATRVPFFRNMVERFMTEIAEDVMDLSAGHPEHFERTYRAANRGKDFTAEEIEATRQAILSDEIKIKASPIVSLLPLLGLAKDTIFPMLVQMRWAFLVAAGSRRFLTCDNPASWVDPTPRPEFYRASGLAMRKVEVTFPIGPRLCLLATWEGRTGEVAAPDRVLHEFNRRRVAFADRYVFANAEDLAGSALEILSALRAEDSARARPE